MKKKKRLLVSFLAIIAFLAFLYISSAPHSPTNPFLNKKTELTPTVSPQGTSITVPVLYIIDGDSIAVSINGTKEEVRLIGIDAPELYGKNGTAQCFAREATDRMKTLVAEQIVTLTSDPTQDDRDVYKRLLRYITLPDGTNINKQLLADGFAREYTHIKPYQYQEEFKNLETDAKNRKRGLWSSCSGQ